MHTAKLVIEHALESGLIITCANDYAEPGYSLADGKVGILLANWNDESKRDEKSDRFVVIDRTMPRLARIAERAGFELEWNDEWCTCEGCGRAVRTNEDSYGWKAFFADVNGSLYCGDCLDPQEYLESLEGNTRAGNTFSHIKPAEHGYMLVKSEMKHGFHRGQNDHPDVVAAALRKLGIDRFLFQIDSVGQFDTSFSVFVHSDDADKLPVAI